MIIRGSVGSTRKMSVKRFSTWSHTPPMYAAETPTITETTVAPRPAPSAITRDSRVLQTSWEKMSWPVPVVPSRCVRVGCSICVNSSACGSYGASTGIVEDDLDENRAAEDESKRHRETGEVRQDGVPARVVEHDAHGRQAFGSRNLDVVLGERVDHGVAHRQDPPADRREHDREG